MLKVFSVLSILILSLFIFSIESNSIYFRGRSAKNIHGKNYGRSHTSYIASNRQTIGEYNSYKRNLGSATGGDYNDYDRNLGSATGGDDYDRNLGSATGGDNYDRNLGSATGGDYND